MERVHGSGAGQADWAVAERVADGGLRRERTGDRGGGVSGTAGAFGPGH